MKKLFQLLFLFNSCIFSQWTQIPQIPAKDIYSVHFDGNNIYAASDSLIYISTNNGTDWHSVAVAEGIPLIITSVIKTGGIIYTGTYHDGVFISTDNGSSWQPFSNGLDSWSKNVVQFLQTGDSLFIATDGGGIYFLNLRSPSEWHSYNNGLPDKIAWTVRSLCRSGNNLIAAAGASGYYYLRTSGSVEWVERTIHPVKMPNVNAFMSMGDTIFAGTVRWIYRSTDMGNNWDSVGIAAMPLQVTHFAKDMNRIYAGYNRDTDFFIWYSDDTGITWKSLDHQFFYLYNFYVHDGRLWAATDQGLRVSGPVPTGIEEGKVKGKGKEAEFRLEQNYPNPFNPSTVISFSLEGQADVRLSVHDMLGRETALLLDKTLNKGVHNVNFDASSLPSGVYFYMISAGSHREIRKMTVIR